MSDSKEQMAELLKVGIKTEIEGQNFYATLAGRIKNPDARKKIEQLAADEVIHEKRLREMYEKFVGGEVGNLPRDGLGIFKDAFGDAPLDEADKFRLLDLAMEAELQAAKMYKEGERQADNSELRKVFAELVAEEDGHFNMLMAEKESLRGNISWFSYGDSAMMEE